MIPGTSKLTVKVTDSSTPSPEAATKVLSITVGPGAGATTISGTHQGPLRIGKGVTLITGATINGPLSIPPGAVVSVAGSHINGPVVSNGAKSLSVCGTTIRGSTTVSRSTGFVLIGDAGDDGSPACGPNTISGSLSVTNNTAGVELGANTITGSLELVGNTGSGPDSENAAPEVEANHIRGSFFCSGNAPAPVDDNHPNTATVPPFGQCAGLA